MATKKPKDEKTKKKGLFSGLYDRLDTKMEESSKKGCSCCGKSAKKAKSCKEEDDGCCN